MELTVQTGVSISAKKLIESMSFEEVAEFCSLLSEKFDGDFRDRAFLAGQMSDGLSEQGCRFLAEIVTQHFARITTDRD